MEEKILEMSAKQFRSYLAEAVKKEIAKRMLKENEEPSVGESEIEKTKFEVLQILKTRSGAGIPGKPDVSKGFLSFLSDFAEKNKISSFMGVSSLEDVADRIVKNFMATGKIEKAKKYADDLVTKYIISKGESKVEKYKAAQAKTQNTEFQGKEEEILELIDKKLTQATRTSKKPKSVLVSGFAAWIKKNFSDIVDMGDDVPTTFAKYADFYSGDTIPQGKSVQADLKAFFDSNKLAWGSLDKTIEDAEKEEEEPSEGEQGKENAKVTEVDGSKLREIGAMLGVSEKAINDFLAAYPAGKVKAIYDVLHNAVMKGKSAEAKRTLETYDAITQRAITMATKEFMLLIDDAIDNTGDPDGNLTATDLAMQIEEAGLYEDVTPEEVQNEMVGLNRIVEIINDPQYADNNFWKNFVAEILRMDLTRKVKVKSGEGKISSPNAFKSFQNLVAKAVGMIDVASFKKDGAGRPSAAIKARMDQAQAAADEIGYQGKIKIGDMEAKEKAAKAAKAPKAPKAV